jgi:type II secretory pathway component PulJ
MHHHPRRLVKRQRGVVLLEVLIALMILAVGGIAMVGLASESLRAVGRARATEAELARANAFLNAVTLWPRADLDRHLGTRRQGPWLMRVDRPLPTLYTITLTDSADRGSAHPLLTTALYRAETFHAMP